MPTDIAHTTAATLAREIRRGERSPVDVVDAVLDRIEHDDAVNAFTATRPEAAREEARAAERAVARGEQLGPLHGVPVALKDLFGFKDGLTNTFGSVPFAEYVPDSSAIMTERLEAAGAIVVGTTNVPEFGHKGVTDNGLFGPTSTPFDLDRNAGGSSGGAAAAVGAGLVPIAQGADGGGSIRIPSSFSGVYGIKPSFGRVPMRSRPDAFVLHTPFIHHGPHARTVEDAALVLDVVAGPHPDDALCLPADDVDSYVAATQRGIDGLEVAYSRHFGDFPVDERVLAVTDAAVDAFETAGATVERVEVDMPVSHAELTDLWMRQIAVYYAEMAAGFAEAGGPDLFERRDELTPEFAALLDRGQEMDAVSFKQTDVVRTGVFEAVQDVFADYDVLVTPTLAVPPVENAGAGEGTTLGPATIDGESVDRCLGFCLTHPINFTGHPAASIPAGFTDDDLPIGLQVVGPRFDDARVLAASGAFERVRPWQEAYEDVSVV
jgi:amidase/aspartyl-tRNA(Asn)/glutamyl-tRNA(Gln) amidotransferase subunit A